MKKLSLSAMALVSLMGGIVSTSHAGFYAGLNTSLFSTMKAKHSKTAGHQHTVNFGYNFPWFVPVEVEAEYSFSKYESQKANSYGLIGHFFLPAPIVSPYLGYGIGSMTIKNGNDQAINQFIAGVKYKIPVAPIAVSSEYRYIIADKVDLYQLLLGVKYMF